ncbi:SOH1-domain-containing protein [Xylariaceae sp. FL0662B]|nr:SOH1-domain-containing protein [Xylariaceae sp. FL0662B]
MSNTNEVAMRVSPPAPPADGEPKYGGYTRFEIELEVRLPARPVDFVQSLANPFYLNHLASQKILNEPAFVAYLDYLQYWSRPPYVKYLNYPGPTLKHLELLQEERFRQDIISPELVQALATEGAKASVDWHKDG